VWYENIRSASFSFVTIHTSDRRTDRRAETELRQQYRALHYMQSHGKNPAPAISKGFPVKESLSNPENKFAQSNLGRRPRLSAVTHICCKVPTGYSGAPKFAHKRTRSRGPIPKLHYLPHPWTRPTYDAKWHPDPIHRFTTMHWTDRPTNRRTYVQTDRSSTGKFDDYRPLHYESDAA